MGRAKRAIGLALLGLAASGAVGHAQSGPTESAVKATYLYKFAPFVEWPASAFPSTKSPFYLCVVGDDAFGAILDKAVSGQRIDERPMAVRRIRIAEEGSGCHILYLGSGVAKTTAESLRLPRQVPVLTVSDQSQGGRGAAIQFVVKNGRVRFYIDTAAASANGVTISSKLLSLAIAVRSGG